MSSDDAREAVAPYALMEQLQDLGEAMPEGNLTRTFHGPWRGDRPGSDRRHSRF